MNSRIFAVGLLALVTALAAAPAAQWPLFKRADAPRLPDGSVDLTAPAPTFLDGKPDLSGVWENPGWSEGAAARRRHLRHWWRAINQKRRGPSCEGAEHRGVF